MKLLSPETPRARLLGIAFLALVFAAAIPTIAAAVYAHRAARMAHDDTHLALTASAAEQLGAWLLEKGAALEAIAVGELWPIARNESARPLALDYLRKNAVRGLRVFRKAAPSSGEGAAPSAAAVTAGNGADQQYMELRLALGFPPVALAATTLAEHLGEAARNGLAVWTDGRTEGLQLFAAVPVPDGVADKLGNLVLVAELDPTSLLRRFAAEARFRFVLFREPSAPLVVADGHAVRGTDGIVLPENVTRWYRDRRPAAAPEVPKSEQTVTEGAAIRLGSFDRGDEALVAAVAPLPVGNLFLYAEYPEKLAEKEAIALGTWTGIAGLAALCLGFAWLLFGTGYLRKAFQQLDQAIGRLGAGDALPPTMPHPAIGATYARLQRSAQAVEDRFRKVRTELEEERQARIELEQRTAQAGAPKEDAAVTSAAVEAKQKLATAVREATDEMKTPILALLGRLERSGELVEAQSAPLEGNVQPHSMPKQLGDVVDEWSRELAARRSEGFRDWLGEKRSGSAVTRVEEDVKTMTDLAAYWQRETRILLADLRFFRDQAEHLKRVAEKLRGRADAT